jgi:putative membrane-bound dehydrogenase-like protein
MKRSVVGLVILGFLALPSAPRAAQITVGAHQFTVPDGFEIERVTDTNLVQRPVSASFDDQGRLYVTDSSGSNEKTDKQLANPTHRVRRLEDSDGDGRFDKSVVFADKVMFPQGCLWHEGSVYVAGPPSIWKFTDTNGDGVADKREEWFKGGTLTGCANDIHGPHLGPDGYLYWTKGAFSEQTHTLGNGRKLNDRASHIYRARPDGSDLDVIMTGGMDNPVEVAFTPEGETLFTSTFIDFTQPGRRDGIGHAVYGGVFGKQNDALEDGRVKRTGPELLHPFVQLGASAPSGLSRYESGAFGPEYRDNLFATSFNLHKVTRHSLRFQGASYASTDSDFVVSENLDFHPTDVLEAADGSMLIVDTGGWYKLCCPSSQLAKADVLGGIYRVRKTAAARLSAPDLKSNQERLTRPPSMTSYTSPAILKRAVWRNHGTNAPWFRELLERHSVLVATNAESAHIVRVLAEGLGRMKDQQATLPLLKIVSRADPADEALNAAVIHALIEIGNPATLRLPLQAGDFPKPLVESRRAALIALDQMDGGGLQPAEVTPLLGSSDGRLRQAASWIVSRHPEWGGALAAYFRNRIAATNLTTLDREELQRQLGQFSRNGEIQELLSATVRGPTSGRAALLIALNAMARAGLKDVPPAWLASVAATLRTDDSSLLRQTVSTARSFSVPKGGHAELPAALLSVARETNTAPEVRLEALATAVSSLPTLDPELFTFVNANLDPAKPVNTRNAAASVLAKAKLTPEQLATLVDLLGKVGPLEMPRLLTAFEKSKDEALGLKLVASLKQVKPSGLRADLVKTLLTNFPSTVQQQGEELLNTLNADAAKQKARLEDLLAHTNGGDVRRGQVIFNSAKAACSACHAIGYLGGKVGPDLTSIGQVRTERDLLEAIVFPSASFVRSYEPMVIVTTSGEDQSGVLRKDAPDEVVLATGPTTEVRIARSEIAEMRPGAVSVMPQGLDEQLSREELADLVAFLKNTKWGPQ